MEHRPYRTGNLSLHASEMHSNAGETAMPPREPPAAPRAIGQIRDVLIVDDHPLMCQALAMTLSAAFTLTRVRVAASLAAAEASIRAEGVPDAVVLDLNLPDVQGVEGVISLKARAIGAPLTVISAEVEPEVVALAIQAGARGFIAKSMPSREMIEAFAAMWRGETVLPPECDMGGASDEAVALMKSFATLTPQQMRILSLICRGSPNKIISYELSISEATVKTHIAAIMSKIKVQNRTQAALLASKARLFSR